MVHLEDTKQHSRQGTFGESNKKHLPLLVKISPDLTMQDRCDIAKVCLELHVDGIIASNTTTTRPENLRSAHKTEVGMV
jgi:dihydroorotate dehydrogenase